MTHLQEPTTDNERPDLWFLFGHERISGWTSKDAFRRARIIEAWVGLGGYFSNHVAFGGGVNTQTSPVRLVVDEDPEGYDDSYLDACDDVTASESAKIREDIQQRIKLYGVVIIYAEWWNGEEWEHADSVSGFIGDEWHRAGADIDMMQAAMDAYHKPLYILELRKGVWQISEDRNDLLMTCRIFEQDPDEFISTIAPAKMRDYSRVDGNLYRRVDK